MIKPVSDLSILIVDDNRYFVSLLRTIVRGFGVKTIYEAPNAVAALETLNSTAVDMAFIDLAMPGIDGIELIGMVRAAKDSPNRTLPIIVLTADSRRNSIMKAIQVGADLYLTKPVRSDDVHSHMSHLLRNPRDYIQVPGVYFGPERRRSINPAYHGPERRKTDRAHHFKTD